MKHFQFDFFISTLFKHTKQSLTRLADSAIKILGYLDSIIAANLVFHSFNLQEDLMKKANFSSQNGLSVLELIIVLAVIAIVVTIAMTQFGDTQARFQRQNMARELKVYLERARYDSIKRRAQNVGGVDSRAHVVLRNATSFEVTTDTNLSGAIDAHDTRQFSFSGRSDVTIVGQALVFPVTIKFDYRGLAEIRDGNGTALTNPVFTICDSGCTIDTANAVNSTVIGITPTGTVVMSNGGETISNINRPSITNVAVPIKCRAIESSNITCSNTNVYSY
jgi:prepilin-type N-terminal cleavage/methylation domain-containing protein